MSSLEEYEKTLKNNIALAKLQNMPITGASLLELEAQQHSQPVSTPLTVGVWNSKTENWNIPRYESNLSIEERFNNLVASQPKHERRPPNFWSKKTLENPELTNTFVNMVKTTVANLKDPDGDKRRANFEAEEANRMNLRLKKYVKS
jgi:hypothetical protein